MRIQAELKWPKLGDSPSGLSAADFYEAFEDNCGLANDSNGMLPSEMLTALKGCLEGSRVHTYKILYDQQRKTGLVESDPMRVYQMIKEKHLRFSETKQAKQIRLESEFPRDSNPP